MPRDDSQRSSGSIIAVVVCAIGVPLLLYFGIFALLLIDETVGNRFVWSNTPDWVHDVIRTIYWPLIAPFQE